MRSASEPSPPPIAEKAQSPIGNCIICLHKAHGIHFGVLSCRACAAFFRRTVVLDRKYKCRRASENCEFVKDERNVCRLCRFKRCIRLGMTTDNVQWNRDRLSTSTPEPKESRKKQKRASSRSSSAADPLPDPEESDYIPQCSQVTSPPSPSNMSMDFYNASQLAFDPPSTSTSVIKDILEIDFKKCQMKASTSLSEQPPLSESPKKQKTLDVSKLSANIQRIFTSYKPEFNYPMHLTALQRMMIAMSHRRRKQNMNPMMLDVLSIDREFRIQWEEQCALIAKWMQHCEEFARLDLKDKLAIFNRSWWAFQRLERIALSLNLFGEEVFTNRKIAVFNDYAMSWETKFKVDAISDYDGDYIETMVKPFVCRMLMEVAKPIHAMQLTDVELVYMLSQLMFHIEGRTATDETMRVADGYRERISNELHDYYIHTKKTPNYAGRLMKMMGLIHVIENIQSERAKVLDVANLFDVFKFEFNCDDMFKFQL